jgi:hypothetical protein
MPKHQLAALDREVAALRLRQAGLTFDQIARRLGYANRSGAWHAVRAGLAATLQEPADELRGLELARLDALHEALWPKAIAGNLRAVDGVLAIMKRRSRLLGLDAPKAVAGDLHVTLQAMVEQVAAECGLDPREVLAEAERMLKQIEKRRA